MPVYCYVCTNPKCQHKKEVIKPMAQSDSQEWCEKCAPEIDMAHIPGTNFFQMKRDLTAEHCWSENCEYQQPVFSDSMGVHPKQVPAAQKIHPWIKYQQDGSIRIDSPAEYRRVRKALHMVDMRKR